MRKHKKKEDQRKIKQVLENTDSKTLIQVKGKKG